MRQGDHDRNAMIGGIDATLRSGGLHDEV